MASLAPYTQTLDYRLAAHLLRRSTYVQKKALIDEYAAYTPQQAVDKLFEIPPHNRPEPIDYDGTGDHYINLGAPESEDFPNPLFMTDGSPGQWRFGTISWWIEEGSADESIAHKLEFFLHSILIADMGAAKNGISSAHRWCYDYMHLFRLTSSRYVNGDFEMDSYKNLALKMITDNLMLWYLNGTISYASDPNENFAREFLELFTIGKGAQIAPGNYTNYTEEDIVTASRILTGWQAKARPLGFGGDPTLTDLETGIQAGWARYNLHDTTDKTFSAAFNETTISGAIDQADMWRELKDFVDMIFAQTATAENICRKIYRYFVHNNINEEIETDIIIPLAQILINNDYKISFAIKELLQSQHFYDVDDSNAHDHVIGGIIKSPLELFMGTMTFFNLQAPDHDTDSFNHYREWYFWTVWNNLLIKGGMRLFVPDTVAGYPAYYQEPGYSRNWFNSATLIARYKLPEILLTGNRILSGGTNGGVQLDIVDFVENSGVFNNPYDAETVIQDMLNYLFPEPLSDERFDYFYQGFLDGNIPEDWTVDWDEYMGTGDASAVKIPLEFLFKAAISSQEYGCM